MSRPRSLLLHVVCVFFPISLFSQGIGINTSSPLSMLDVEGGLAVGTSYSGNVAAPANGAIIEGSVGIGSSMPGAKLDVSGAVRTDNQFISTIVTGTAPLNVTSTTVVTNLNADQVDGLHAASFVRSDDNDNVSGHTEWQDNFNVRLGTGADLRLFHDGANSHIRNYTGDFYLRNLSHGNRILLQAENTTGTNMAMLYADPDNDVELYYAGVKKFQTTTYGAQSLEGLNIGNTTNATAGNMRWSGTDFEGYNGSSWVSFTAGANGSRSALQAKASITTSSTSWQNIVNESTSGVLYGCRVKQNSSASPQATIRINIDGQTYTVTKPTGGWFYPDDSWLMDGTSTSWTTTANDLYIEYQTLGVDCKCLNAGYTCNCDCVYGQD